MYGERRPRAWSPMTEGCRFDRDTVTVAARPEEVDAWRLAAVTVVPPAADGGDRVEVKARADVAGRQHGPVESGSLQRQHASPSPGARSSNLIVVLSVAAGCQAPPIMPARDIRKTCGEHQSCSLGSLASASSSRSSTSLTLTSPSSRPVRRSCLIACPDRLQGTGL